MMVLLQPPTIGWAAAPCIAPLQKILLVGEVLRLDLVGATACDILLAGFSKICGLKPAVYHVSLHHQT